MPNEPSRAEEIVRRNIGSPSKGEFLPVAVAAGKNRLRT